MKTDKTIREYLEMMEEPERSQALENMEKLKLFDEKQPDNIMEAICYAFAWHETPQDHEYWSSMADKYENR